MTTEMTLYRCYWPPAHAYLKAAGERAFVSKAYDLLMTLEVEQDHAYGIAARLPAGAVIDIVPLEAEPLETQDIDDLLFFPSLPRLPRLNKN